MQRAKLNRGQLPQHSTESLLIQREGQLVCRECRKPCKKKGALRAGRQALRCPGCGGILERDTESALHG